MARKKIELKKRHIFSFVVIGIIVLACIWAFIYAGVITRAFKDKISDSTYNAKEANIENLLVTETKDGKKLWELFADVGMYTDVDGIVLLENLLGNVYEGDKVKASFKADRGTYNSETKQIILFDNVIMVYIDGTSIMTDRLTYNGKGEDIVAEGHVRIEKPKEAVVMGSKAILSGDYKDFNIVGRTETHFYM